MAKTKSLHLFLILLILVHLSTEQKVYELKETTQFQAKTKDEVIIRLFSLKDIPSALRFKEWYAFLELQVPENNFVDKVYVELSTVDIATKVPSEPKVKCESQGEHFSDCFIGSNQINPATEYLRVKLDLMGTFSGQMYIEIDEAKSLKVNQGYLLQKGVSNFSRILRLDTKTFPSKFSYLVCEMKALNQEPDYNQLFYFLISKEETPPNHFRHSQTSRSLWANNQQVGFTFIELQQTQFLTLTLQIIGPALFEVKCSTVGGGAGKKETMQLQINKSYHQLYIPSKVYHLNLPQQRKPSTYYLVSVEAQLFSQLVFNYVKLNKKAVNADDLQRMNNESSFFRNDGYMQLWLNQTYNQVEFQVKLVGYLTLTISVEEYNLDLIEIRPGRAWLYTLQVNQTEHLYFTTNSKNVKDSISFDVELMAENRNQTSDLDLKFYYCTQKTIQLCQQSVYSNDTILKKTALPRIMPKVTNYPEHKKFSFLNLYVTMYEIREKVYQSIIVIEISAKKKELFSLSWHPFKPLQTLQQNKMVRGYLDERAKQTYYFSAFNITKIHYARIDFLFEGTAQIFVSNKFIDLQTGTTNDSFEQQNYYRFQNSITIPKIESMKNYYIYIMGVVRGNYRLRLSYGYNFDDSIYHPIGYVSANQHYKREITMQPSQIVFIEVVSDTNLYLTIQNSITLKFCYLKTTSRPTSHKDVTNSTYCTDIKTQNHFLMGTFNNIGRSYAALQNQQQYPVFAKITTENENLQCRPQQMGQKNIVTQYRQTIGGCSTYQITHKGEIQVSTDVSNPQLQSMSHLVMSIGKDFKFKMASNIKIIKADQIDLACKRQYDQCYLKVAIEPSSKTNPSSIELPQKTNPSLASFSIFISYTNRPLLLSDGIGHPNQLAKGEIKHFKYPLPLAKSIMVMIKQNEYLDEYTIYAKLVTINEKFTYPDSQEYYKYLNAKDRSNLSEVYTSKTNWLIGTPNMKIGQDKITQYCQNQSTKQCYLLISVQNTQFIKGEFTIQVTQTVHTIKLGSPQDAYLSKGDFDYFSFYNTKPNSSVLFLISSHASICHKVAVYEGNTDITKAISLDHYSQVIIQKSKEGWYTIIVQATDDCFYSIQASSSEKQLVELNFGFAAPFALKNAEKRYFLLRNQDLDKIKIIGGIDRNQTGEVILRGIPVTDNQVTDFMQFINGQAEVGKKNKLDYAWTHKNHLVIRSSDAKYCKDCFICLEVQAVGDASGFLAVSSNNLENVQMNTESVMYDILLKAETFTWIFRYINLQSVLDINLQAGAIKVQFFQNDTKLLQKNEIKYDKFNPNNSKITLKANKSFVMSYLSIKVTAIENADYSVTHYSSKNKKPSDSDMIEVGRPKNILFNNNNTYCIKGKTNDDPTEFVLILKDDHFVKTIKDTDEEAKLVAEKLVVDTTVNGKAEKMKIERVKHNFLITFENPLAIINQTYNVCFNVRNDSSQHRATLILLGNLNYFSENEPIHIRKGANLTFMSDGRGLIQMDQCSSRATLVLSTKYDGLTKSTSNLNHRRVINNYITFNYIGPIYLGVQTEDFVTLRWKNYHSNSLNGYAYDYFSASTFRLHQSKTLEQLSLTIKPLIVDEQDKANLPQILQIVYDIYIAKEQSDLYNGMNCERGNFMHFSRRITTMEQYGKELQVHLNNRQDVRKAFKNNEYALITVKALLDVKWKNNVVENYRFHYPYQQLMLWQRKSIIDNQKTEEKIVDEHYESKTVYMVVIAVLLFMLVTIVLVGLITYVRRRYRPLRLMQEDLPVVSSQFEYKEPTEMIERSQNKI